MTTIVKELTFDAAHMLSNYEGKCNNLHGHTYKVQVVLKGDLKSDMVLDFNHIKSYFDTFDHAIIFASSDCREEFEKELFNLCLKYRKKHAVIDNGRPTAENMSIIFSHNILNMYLNLDTVTVSVWETPTAFASHTATRN